MAVIRATTGHYVYVLSLSCHEVNVGVCGLCCSQRPCRCVWSMLPQEAMLMSIIRATTETMLMSVVSDVTGS